MGYVNKFLKNRENIDIRLEPLFSKEFMLIEYIFLKRLLYQSYKLNKKSK